MWSFFGSKRVTDKRLENALKSRAGIMQELIIRFGTYNFKKNFQPLRTLVLGGLYFGRIIEFIFCKIIELY